MSYHSIVEGKRKGRGASLNPEPRYGCEQREAFDDGWVVDELQPQPIKTSVKHELAKKIINPINSPDLPISQSINPYRGCEHGCIYCYARPAHAYVDLSPGIDFETKLFAKTNAAELLRKELAKKNYQCQIMSLGANTDPYQPIEKQYRITRQIIEVIAEHKHPLQIVTKSSLVERDIDLLAPMAANHLAQVFISITTLDRDLARRMEPRATAPQRRLKTIEKLAKAGIPVGVMFAPVIPVLNDHDMENVLKEASEHGARYAGYVMLRLPYEVKDLFKDWLAAHYPDKAEHVMARIRDIRNGKENNANYGQRLVGQGIFANLIRQRFKKAVRNYELNKSDYQLNKQLFRKPSLDGQMVLF